MVFLHTSKKSDIQFLDILTTAAAAATTTFNFFYWPTKYVSK